MVPIGRIPFSSIIAADWSPDSFTGLPRIFCHFDHRHTPCEAVVLDTLGTGQRVPGVELVDQIGLRSVINFPGDLKLHLKMNRSQRRFSQEVVKRIREFDRKG